MTKPLLFIAAERRECAPWVSHWDNADTVNLPVHWARTGTWRGRRVMAIANGAGPVRATAAVNAAPAPAAICSIGFCGALDESLTIGEVVTASEVRNESGVFPALSPHGPWSKTGVLISETRIIRTAAEKRRLREKGCAIVEMEAGAVARASEKLNVPFYCIRAVSDLASEDLANDFNRSLMPNGRFSLLRLIAGALRSPVSRFGELIRLSRRTRLASQNLGEYLAACTF